MQPLRAVLVRSRGGLIYAIICIVLVPIFAKRAWEHLATLNGDEWNPIQSFVRAHQRGSEPICFLPSWTVGYAVDQYKFRGIEVIEHPTEAWEGLAQPKAGFWVVSQFGAFDESQVPEKVYPHRDHIEIGGAHVFLFRTTPFTWEKPLSLRLPEAQCVLTVKNQRPLKFQWYRKGFLVPRSFPNRRKLSYLGCYVAAGTFAGQAHSGIWFHPPRQDESLTLTWPEIELERRWLEVGGGFRDGVAARKAPPVNLEVSLDGKALHRISFPAQRGWSTHAVDLGNAATSNGKKGRLAFKVWAAKNHSRHLIFNASFKEQRPLEREPNESKNSLGVDQEHLEDSKSATHSKRPDEDVKHKQNKREGQFRSPAKEPKTSVDELRVNGTSEEG